MSNLKQFLTSEGLRLYRQSFLLNLMEELDFKFTCVFLTKSVNYYEYSCSFVNDGKSITTSYSKGLGHIVKNGPNEGKPIPAMPHEVMGSLISEALGIEGQTFENWAEGFGYDTDSRKAYAIYQQILENTNQLRGLWGDDWSKAVVAYQTDVENGLF